MELKVAAFTISLFSVVGLAQAASSSSPFSRQDAQVMSSVRPGVLEPRDFSDIDGRSIRNDDRPSARAYDEETGPFTKSEAHDLSAVWPKIREAASFDDINWRSVGLEHAPGDHDARAFMAGHWDSLKRAARFEDINWRAEYGDR
jgi:hypothetical protein